MFNTIIWNEKDNIGNLILNQPPSNKMTKAFFDELKDLVDNVIPKSNVQAIIIYGNGRHFSSGADLDDLLNNINNSAKIDSSGTIVEYSDFLKENYKTFLFFDKLDIPVIAAIRGVCLGSALELALFCHIRLCGESSVLGFPETTYNIMPGCGGIQKFVSIAGTSKALELLLQGNSFSPDEALQWNIIHKIVPKKKVVEIAFQLAKTTAKNYKKEQIKTYIRSF